MSQAVIQSGFWYKRLEVNTRRAIFHQWEQLEASGCIENFRIAAGRAEGFREGWFFADSDAYKWLEAAARIWADSRDSRLGALIDGLIELLAAAQAPDGYLFTYNQIHFPSVRWRNLQIEHELYCHGHLIEAGVSHFETTGRTGLLDIARRAADRIVADFCNQDAAHTPGHEEIEIALLRLHNVTPRDTAYLELARQLIELRGRTLGFALSLARQNADAGRRSKLVRQKRWEYLATHLDFKPFQLPPGNISKKPRGSTLRWYANALSGKYFQQHAPIRKQTEPVGHSVRFAYLETATARLARETGDRSLLPALEQAWERMVTRRMYVTGGIGSAPGLEGFGRDYELDPEYAYAETCAALGSLFWNWEMAQITGEAKYSDLFEWQLYNAAAVGIGLDGETYLYNNPLACHGGVERRAWYAVPCCPSNLSRTWADLDRYILSASPGQLTIHQYIDSRLQAEVVPAGGADPVAVRLKLEAGLPWNGHVKLAVTELVGRSATFDLLLRRPAWAGEMQVIVNGEPVGSLALQSQAGAVAPGATASGYDPRPAVFLPLSRLWAVGDVVEINFDLPLRLLRAHPKVEGHHGKIAVTRGPLVYCLEDVDNPRVDLFAARLDTATLRPVFDPDLLDGTVIIQAQTCSGDPLTLIPYFLWGNRGPSQMAVWINS